MRSRLYYSPRYSQTKFQACDVKIRYFIDPKKASQNEFLPRILQTRCEASDQIISIVAFHAFHETAGGLFLTARIGKPEGHVEIDSRLIGA
jgi:hypothetical protein